MTWPFENDTSAITKKLAKKKFAKRAPELMIVVGEADGGVSCRLGGNCDCFPNTNETNTVISSSKGEALGMKTRGKLLKE